MINEDDEMQRIESNYSNQIVVIVIDGLRPLVVVVLFVFHLYCYVLLLYRCGSCGSCSSCSRSTSSCTVALLWLYYCSQSSSMPHIFAGRKFLH